MSTIPKFVHPTTDFHAELRHRINQYFQDRNLPPTGNLKLYVKALILALSLAGLYVHLVFFTPHWAVAVLECLLLGMATAAIGFNIMHDGAHGSFSQKKWLNEMAGLSLNFLGANVFLWKTKHNLVHHTYTNIDEVDDDINARPFLRLCESQKKHAIHKYQHLYFPLAYAFLYLYWVFFTDYQKYFTKRVGVIPIQHMTLADHLVFWGFKLLHILVFVMVPVWLVGVKAWLIGFLLYACFTGIILSIVFQLAHTVEATHFPSANEKGKMEDEWAVHQISTTANFATQNKLISWFTGGLNFQVEHHLFPKISHVHYPEISKIVKQVCQEYNIKYHEYKRTTHAVLSHIRHLKNMGVA